MYSIMPKAQVPQQAQPLKSNKKNLLFILGRETVLSLAEIKAFFLSNNIDFKIVHNKELISLDFTSEMTILYKRSNERFWFVDILIP